MPLTLLREDITNMKVDVIVNAANTQLKQGGGVCGAIFNKAGVYNLKEACDALAPIQTGDAVMTPGFNLKAPYIIHTVGPIYHDMDSKEAARLLAKSYRTACELAFKHQLHSIAFPLISAGVYGYPKEEALSIAMNTLKAMLKEHDLDIYLVVFDTQSFKISQARLDPINSYIDEHYIDTHQNKRSSVDFILEAPSLMEVSQRIDESSVDFISKLDASFSETLLAVIDAKKLSDVEVYKRANMDRKLFSKIRSTKGYTPRKKTVLALAIALELSLDETDSLLSKAGYTLSSSILFDVVVSYFIEHEIYDIYAINEVLFTYDQGLLGS